MQPVLPRFFDIFNKKTVDMDKKAVLNFDKPLMESE